MNLPLRLARFVVCFLPLALPAAAQLDSSALRAKYGSPLNRETFRLPQGFDLIVDYGAGNQVCRLLVPALMPAHGQVSRASEMKQRMYDFLADLVPGSMRGKEIGRMMETWAQSLYLGSNTNTSISPNRNMRIPSLMTTRSRLRSRPTAVIYCLPRMAVSNWRAVCWSGS